MGGPIGCEPDVPCGCRSIQVLEMIVVGNRQGNADAMPFLELV